MAITGTHMLFYTSEADQLRAMLRDVFGFKHVDAGGGWLIFRLPPSEIGVHPTKARPTNPACVTRSRSCATTSTRRSPSCARKAWTSTTATKDEGYGITTMIHLPGGCDVMLYEPRHAIAADIKTEET